MNLDAVAPQDVVDGFMLPAQMSSEQKRQADQQLALIRQKRIAEMSDQEKLYGQLLQLKIHIEDYIKEEVFDPKKGFSYFLKSYIELQHKKKNEVASELNIHKTKLSQLLSGNRAPSDDIFIRLEFHSNQFITARDWFRLSVKQQEYTIMTNTSLRNEEKQHLKGHLQLEF
ncbi:helix-turn-helix transcriptional regulator [Dyadobacter sp. CY347]|uniref:helix-turn-helix domain-containing protein n=1 Tax=Dyadobacter sp. CY347 TaxID=2909336 RepID=UPI001F23DC0B|nr:helix-turn-helix transcriptional regulator [Dyadobacter sp. CY347]MCF2491617.1 helix-turn-helix domain-containing protein [Dyadobacter sp. CY347]